MLPAILNVSIPLFAEPNDRVNYKLGDKGMYLENQSGLKIHAKAGTEILKMWRVK